MEPRGLPRLSNQLWLVPLLGLVAGIALALATIAIDRATDNDLISQRVVGTPTDAQSILTLVAQATVTLSSIVLTLTLVAVQLAMGQFSPRIVRALLSDRRSQAAMALFLATFVFSLVALREIDDSAPGGGTVPSLTVLVAYVLAVASVAGLLLYVNHVARAIRVSGLIDLVGDETRHQLDRRHPPAADGRPGPAPDLVAARDSGVVTRIHEDRLVAAARDAGCMFELIPGMGEFVPTDGPLLRVHGDAGRVDHEGVAALVELGPERTHVDDPAYGVRKLVDIAERSIASSPFDDPTTCVMAIHRIHDCLRLLATRSFPSGHRADEHGELRLVRPVLDWSAYVRLAFDELRLVGAGSPQVARRLRAALLDLLEVAPPERRPPLEHQLILLEAGVRRAFDDEDDVHAALVPDQDGIGAGADLKRDDRAERFARRV